MNVFARLLAFVCILTVLAVQPVFAAGAEELEKVLEQGRVARNNDRFEEGIAAYKKAAEMTGDSASVLISLADIYNRAGQHQAAADTARKAVAKATTGSDRAGAHCQLGVALARLGQVKEAEAALRQAIADHPEVDTARLNLVHLLRHHGRGAEADALLAQIPTGSALRPFVDWTQGFLGSHKEAERISGPNPGYPAEAAQAQVAGRMTLSATVDTAGNISDVKVVKGLPHGLSENGIKALSLWKLKPATLDGRVVAGYFEVTFLLQAPPQH